LIANIKTYNQKVNVFIKNDAIIWFSTIVYNFVENKDNEQTLLF